MNTTGVKNKLHPDVMFLYTMYGGHAMLKLTEVSFKFHCNAAWCKNPLVHNLPPLLAQKPNVLVYNDTF